MSRIFSYPHMTTCRLSIFLICTVLLLTIFGCGEWNRNLLTKFEPISLEAGAQVFKYTAYADVLLPLKSEEAERTRMDWLETWLKNNGYNPKKFEVISRRPVLRQKGLLGDIYDIFYEVRVDK